MEGLDEATMWLLALRDALDELDVQLDTFEQTRAAVAMAGTPAVAMETKIDRIEARLDSEMKAITRAMKLRHQD